VLPFETKIPKEFCVVFCLYILELEFKMYDTLYSYTLRNITLREVSSRKAPSVMHKSSLSCSFLFSFKYTWGIVGVIHV